MTAAYPEEHYSNGAALRSGHHSAPLRAYRTTSKDSDADLQLHFGGKDAYLVRLHLQSTSASTLIEGEKRIELRPRTPMQCCLADVSARCSWVIRGSFDIVNFELSRSAIAGQGSRNSLVPIHRLRNDIDVGTTDQTIASFGFAAIQAMENSGRFDQFYTDHLLEGICSYIAQRFFEPLPGDAGPGRLAAWQERRAKDIMNAAIDSDVSLKDVARQCELSVGHFTRAFKQSTGSSPHKWLLERRIDKATRLLGETRIPLADVAALCGFVDQSHMTNVFTRSVGIPPGLYRKTHDAKSPAKPLAGLDEQASAPSGNRGA